MSDRQRRVVSRVIIVALGLASTMIAIDPPDLIFTLIMFSIALVMPLFPILVAALYWRRATRQGAVAAAVIGTVLVMMTYFVWDVGNTWYGAIGLLGSTLALVVVSMLTRQDDDESRAFFALLARGMRHNYAGAESLKAVEVESCDDTARQGQAGGVVG